MREAVRRLSSFHLKLPQKRLIISIPAVCRVQLDGVSSGLHHGVSVGAGRRFTVKAITREGTSGWTVHNYAGAKYHLKQYS